MKTLVQLFSARDFQPRDSVLDKVQQVGYDGVEGFSTNYVDPAAFRALLDERGVSTETAEQAQVQSHIQNAD